MLDIPAENVGKALRMLKEGDYKKIMLPLLDFKSGSLRSIAFNEVGIQAREPQTIMFNVSYMDRQISIEGDGVLVATPQGSTGWSFSAQGTYLDRRSKALVITMLNPLMMPLKSIVIPQVPVIIELKGSGYKPGARIVSDGISLSEIEKGDMVRIRLSKKKATVYRFFDTDPMDSLLESIGRRK